MTDDHEIKSRADVFAPDPPPPLQTTLPPAAKTSREIGHAVRDIALPAMALLAAKWGIVDGYVFAGALFLVLGGSYALRKGDGTPDTQAILAALLRR
jgi:hypothetical protein